MFDYNDSPTDSQIHRMALVRAAYKTLADTLLAEVPESRERSVALTELETSAFWANSAIAHNDTDLDLAQKADNPYEYVTLRDPETGTETRELYEEAIAKPMREARRAARAERYTPEKLELLIQERISAEGGAKDWNY